MNDEEEEKQRKASKIDFIEKRSKKIRKRYKRKNFRPNKKSRAWVL